MEAEGKTGKGQTMRVFEGQIKRLSFIPRVKRSHGGQSVLGEPSGCRMGGRWEADQRGGC